MESCGRRLLAALCRSPSTQLSRYTGARAWRTALDRHLTPCIVQATAFATATSKRTAVAAAMDTAATASTAQVDDDEEFEDVSEDDDEEEDSKEEAPRQRVGDFASGSDFLSL
jgi:hypothetical protein